VPGRGSACGHQNRLPRDYLVDSLHAVDKDLADEQLAAIAQLVAIAERLSVPVWLRGGWAVDFFLGRVTRAHADIDWFALAGDGFRLAAELMALEFEHTTTAPSDQQIDLVRGHIDHGIGLVRLGSQGEPLVGGGPWAGEPWPADMLNGPVRRIDGVSVRVIAPLAQIEIKEMTPTWNPALRRRQKDLDDIKRIRAKLARLP
jgi:hypothetical protein